MVMLVLSRKKNESIIIDNDIIVNVVEIRDDKVRLGVEAPPELSVHRGELYVADPRGQDERMSRFASTRDLVIRQLQRENRALKGGQERMQQRINDLERQVLELQAQLTN